MKLGTTAASVARLIAERSSVKYTRYREVVLPLSVAEMDYPVAEPVAAAIIDRVKASDFGYIDGPGPLAPAFSLFAEQRWGWRVDPETVHVATDVSVAIVETLRYAIPTGSRVVINPPVYPPFYELVDEAGAERVEVPLRQGGVSWSIDLSALEQAFIEGASAYLLCNPHNPMGLVHSRATLEEIAKLAARYNVLVISDEVHGPLTHPGTVFTPFLAIAEQFGARAVCVTSASKGWNLAGTKCAILVAGDAESQRVLAGFPEEVACRTSILGLHANVAALSSVDWLDGVVAKIVANDQLLAELIAEHLPGVRYYRPKAGYLGWLDFRPLGLGDDPASSILHYANVALNSGPTYGEQGRGYARVNLACEPDTLIEAVLRIEEWVR
ncbi:MAG: MalY/PatB family protein [Rhodoglobus sp.]